MNPIVKRVLTALATASAVVAALLFTPVKVILPLLILIVALVQLEFSQMVSRKCEIMTWTGIVMGVAWLIGVGYGGSMTAKVAFAIFFALGLWAWVLMLFGKWKTPLVALGTTFLGFIYIPMMLTGFMRILQLHGPVLFLYVIALVKFSDMGGFALGVAFGRHKLCPKISPNKSWEGLFGSLLAAVVMSLLWLPITHFAWPKAVMLGAIAALVGTFGDLVESRFKREFEVKDSATFMPAGLGGFLDMFDSLVFAPMALLPLL